MAKGSKYAQSHRVDHEEGEPDGFYPTFPAATAALLSVEEFHGAIWEPACGEGDISKVLEAAGYEVISSDLIDRGYGETGVDFLRQWTGRAPNVFSNPPFHLALQFVKCALQLTAPDPGANATHKVVMFLRLAFLEGIKRKKFFENTPLKCIYVMSRRVPMDRAVLSEDGEAHGMLAFAWFVWEHGYQGEPVIRFLDWKNL